MTFSLPRTTFPLRRRLHYVFLSGASLLLLTSAAAQEGARPASRPGDYRIAARDLVQFQMFEEPDVQVQQRVTATGDIRLPMVGTVNVEGLTLREAEAKLRQLFIEGGFFINPQVILSLQQYDQRSVSVLGQVNRPDEIPLPLEAESLSLIRAVTLAGGLTRIARSEAVQITRRTLDGTEHRFTVNLDAALINRESAGGGDFHLQSGDIVFIPERNF